VRPVYANISRDDKGADLPGDGLRKEKVGQWEEIIQRQKEEVYKGADTG
jgi:hypothetical protein